MKPTRWIVFALGLLAAQDAHAGVLDIGGLLPPRYFHTGFNQIAAGLFYPFAGASRQQAAGFITPAIEHDAADGALFIHGLSYNPVNLGYKGSTADLHDFLRGSLEFGPSVQAGETVKSILRWACGALPGWQEGNYGALRGVLAPEGDLYADVGVYAGLPLNQFTRPSKMTPSLDIGATVVKKFGPGGK